MNKAEPSQSHSKAPPAAAGPAGDLTTFNHPSSSIDASIWRETSASWISERAMAS